MRRAGSLGVDAAGCVSSALASLCKRQPVAVFIPAPWHASALLLVFILLRPHRKKSSCFPKQSVLGLHLHCSFSFFVLSSTAFIFHPASQGRRGVPGGTMLFQRQSGASQGGCPGWDIKHKTGQKIDKASFGLSDSEKQGAQLVGLLLPQKGKGGLSLILGAPWGMRGCMGRGCLFFQVQTQPSPPQPWPWPQWATWLCRLGKVVMGHFAGLSVSSPWQLPGLPAPYKDCRRKCPGLRGKASKPELTQLF